MDFQKIYNEAHAAGMEAGTKAKPSTMYIRDSHTGQVWAESEGACGFARVRFPAITAWGRWSQKAGVAKKWTKGLAVSVHEFNQSHQRKEAYAVAFAAVLKKHGIDCYVESVLD